MKPRAGLLMDEGRLTLAVVSAGGDLECVAIDPGDNPGAQLAGELDRQGYKRRRLRVGLDRNLVVVKELEMPRVGGGSSFGQMVRFELELYVPFSPEHMASDWSVNPGRANVPLRVLVGACESRTLDQALRLVNEARRRPRSVSVACHDLRALLSRELVREIQRTLLLLQWRDCQALWISGDETERFLSAPALFDLGMAVSEPPYAPEVQEIVDHVPETGRGAALLALAVALGSSHPRINLLPRALRPHEASRGQLVTAVMVGLTLLLGVGLLGAQVYQRDRYVQSLSQEIRRLDPEVKVVERLATQVAQKRKLVSALAGVEANGMRVLPFLRDLTELLPQDAWLQALSLEPQGVELIGQADGASQLIQKLEASPWLERVEFTSPVTKTQSKDQFRLRASWERR